MTTNTVCPHDDHITPDNVIKICAIAASLANCSSRARIKLHCSAGPTDFSMLLCSCGQHHSGSPSDSRSGNQSDNQADNNGRRPWTQQGHRVCVRDLVIIEIVVIIVQIVSSVCLVLCNGQQTRTIINGLHLKHEHRLINQIDHHYHQSWWWRCCKWLSR